MDMHKGGGVLRCKSRDRGQRRNHAGMVIEFEARSGCADTESQWHRPIAWVHCTMLGLAALSADTNRYGIRAVRRDKTAVPEDGGSPVQRSVRRRSIDAGAPGSPRRNDRCQPGIPEVDRATRPDACPMRAAAEIEFTRALDIGSPPFGCYTRGERSGAGAILSSPCPQGAGSPEIPAPLLAVIAGLDPSIQRLSTSAGLPGQARQ